MEENQYVLGIILKSVPYQDRSLILKILTETLGKITAIGINAKSSKRFSNHLDLFHATELRLAKTKGEISYRIEETKSRKSFDLIAKDYEKLLFGSFFLEVIEKSNPEEEESERQFKILSHALTVLEKTENLNSRLELTSKFLIKTLYEQGFYSLYEPCEHFESSTEEHKFSLDHLEQKALCSSCKVRGDRMDLTKKEVLSFFGLVDAGFYQSIQSQEEKIFYHAFHSFFFHHPVLRVENMSTYKGLRASLEPILGR